VCSSDLSKSQDSQVHPSSPSTMLPSPVFLKFLYSPFGIGLKSLGGVLGLSISKVPPSQVCPPLVPFITPSSVFFIFLGCEGVLVLVLVLGFVLCVLVFLLPLFAAVFFCSACCFATCSCFAFSSACFFSCAIRSCSAFSAFSLATILSNTLFSLTSCSFLISSLTILSTSVCAVACSSRDTPSFTVSPSIKVVTNACALSICST